MLMKQDIPSDPGIYNYCIYLPLQEMEKQPTEFDPVPMDSEDDLFIAYTSGTSSKPRRIVHTQAGYLLYAAFTHKVCSKLTQI